MDENLINKKPLVKLFGGVLSSLVNGDDYKAQPPQGPPNDLPTLTNQELHELQLTYTGENLSLEGYSYSEITLVEDPMPVEVRLPERDLLQDINIVGIDGSNQKVERASFYFIMARSSVVEFRYSSFGAKPYFYNTNRDACAVVWVDGNVFTDDIKLYTKEIARSAEDNYDLLKHLDNIELPFLVRYDSTKVDKSPSSHALGWAVKLQQALELASIKDVPTHLRTICIKDGPLFSTSVSPQETVNGLDRIFAWNDQILVACSKRIKDSKLLIEALTRNIPLRNYWFKNQNITEQTLKSIATDSLILPRILKPGYRTPLMEALPVARKQVVDLEERLMPLACYYLSRNQPYTYIRLEIPRFMWQKNPDKVEQAIQIVAWQHELGHKAPLVQLAADKRCQLGPERLILEKQTIAALNKHNLEFPEPY